MAHSKESLTDGELRVDDGALRYIAKDGSFDVGLVDIALAGEYTTPYGPAACDYFLVFVTTAGVRHEASGYAAGLDAALDALQSYWQVSLHPQLMASTSFRSNIVWPPQYAGEELFQFVERPALGFLGRIRARIGLSGLVEHWSPAALETLLDVAHRELDDDPGRALAMTQRILEEAGESAARHRHVHGRAWKEHGTALYMAGRLGEALEASQRARAIFEEDPQLVSDRASALLLTALVQNARKDNEANEAALVLLEECMSAFAACNDSRGMLKALELRGIVLFDLRRYSEAVSTLQHALTEVSKLGDERELARIENNIGRCALQAENHSEAMRYVQKAAFRFNELKMEAECARAWWCMARIHEALGEKTDALRGFQRVEKEFRKLGMTSMAEKASEDRTRLAGAA